MKFTYLFHTQVIRNPMDALVSYYHFCKVNFGLGLFRGTWDEFFAMVRQHCRIVCIMSASARGFCESLNICQLYLILTLLTLGLFSTKTMMCFGVNWWNTQLGGSVSTKTERTL